MIFKEKLLIYSGSVFLSCFQQKRFHFTFTKSNVLCSGNNDILNNLSKTF